MKQLWPAGSATGVGSLPGTDIVESLRLVFGELPDLPHLPELPARGPGADLIGRSSALLIQLPVEVQPSGWRLTARPGLDLRRAREFLARDLDALDEQAERYAGVLKVQVAGPWTLAASVELPSGHRVVTDHGATRDLISSLAEGVRTHVADLARRLPDVTLVVQLDEPSLPAVLAGTVPTPSGYGTVRAIEASVVEDGLRDVLAATPIGAVHCCAADVPVGLIRAAGAAAIGVDLSLMRERALDALGEAVDAGVALWLGVIPATDTTIDLGAARDPVHRLWQVLGFPAERLAASVVVTPACGLAGASPAYVRRALTILRDVGRSFAEA